MKKYLLMTLVVLAMVGTSACNNGNEKSQQTLADDSSASQSSTSHIESEVRSEVEDSKPDLFEREEQSLEPVTSDNIIDSTTLPGSTSSETEESLNGGETSEQVSEQVSRQTSGDVSGQESTTSGDVSGQESTASGETEQESSSHDIGGLS